MTAIRKFINTILGVGCQDRAIPTGVGLTLCAGVIVSVLTSILVWKWELGYQIRHLQQHGDRLATTLQQNLARELQIVWASGKFYSISGSFDRLLFRDFAHSILPDRSSIRALAWIPRVSDAQRRADKTALQNQANENIQILEQTPEGQWVAAQPRSEYFPATYIEPATNRDLVEGFDLGSVQTARLAMENASTTGNLVVTNSMQLLQDEPVLLVFMPVYPNSRSSKRIVTAIPNDGDFNSQPLEGFVLAVFSVKKIIESPLSELNISGMNVCLWDRTAPVGERLLAFYSSESQQAIAIPPATTADGNPSQLVADSPCIKSDQLNGEPFASNASSTLQVGGREWFLQVLPNSEYHTLHSYWRAWTVLIGGLCWTSISVVTLLISGNRTTRVQRLVPKLSQENSELSEAYSQITLLNHMSDLLQACLTVEEAYTVISTLLEPLFPKHSGCVYEIAASKNVVETIAHWGKPLNTELIFSPDECLAMRRGQLYWVKDTDRSLLCKHLHRENLPGEYLCIPMVAHGEIWGVLYLSSPESGQITDAQHGLAVMVARQIAMALANLKLRETLKNQSIRDPLTNLYNRRYMEEFLEREIRRAERSNYPVTLIMLDVDHFKQFNDTYGHEAGDLVLRELALFLQRHLRESDIICRYGGEEFTLILPEAPLTAIEQRAEKLREGVKDLNLQYQEQPIGRISISLGVASFPQHGLSGFAVLQAADAALYRAKNEGRDRVVIALP